MAAIGGFRPNSEILITKSTSFNPLHTWCIHWLSYDFWTTLAKFRPSGGRRKISVGGFRPLLVCDLNRTPVVMAKHGGPCVHCSGISTCGRTSREIVSHPLRPPLPTLYKISLPVYYYHLPVIVTNKKLQPLTTTWFNSLVLSFSLLKI